MDLIWLLLIGLVAGWLATRVMKGHKRHKAVVLLLIGAWSASASAEVSTEQVKRENAEAVQMNRAYAEQKKEDYQKKIQTELDEWDAKVTALKEKTKKGGAQTRARLEKEILKLQDKINAAKKKSNDLKTETSSRWDILKEGIDQAMDDLKASYEKMKESGNP